MFRRESMRAVIRHDAGPPVIRRMLTKAYLTEVALNGCVVAAKSPAGIEQTLVLGTFPDTNRSYAALIDSAGNMRQVELYAPKYLFKGSVFHGELIVTNECERFLVADVSRFAGRRCGNAFQERHATMKQSFCTEEQWDYPKYTVEPNLKKRIRDLAETQRVVALPATPPLFIEPKAFVMLRSIHSLSGHDGFEFTAIARDAHVPKFVWYRRPVVVLRYTDGKLTCRDVTTIPGWRFILNDDSWGNNGLVEVYTTVPRKGKIVCTLYRYRQDRRYADRVDDITPVLADYRTPVTFANILQVSHEMLREIKRTRNKQTGYGRRKHMAHKRR